MTALGIFPRRLATVQPPKCAGCIFGVTTKKPWRAKDAPGKVKNVVVRGPWDCFSVDQLESSKPGKVAQLEGILTKRMYTCAIVFMDHFSRLGYLNMQQQLTSNETVEAKYAFEAFSRSQGVTIKHYHAANGRFADNAFIKDVREEISSKSITLCGVNSHAQNGISDNHNMNLQEPTRKQLLHANARWPAAVTTNMWPYTLRNTQHMRNSFQDRKDGTWTPDISSGVEVDPNLKANHTFGCPAYALNSKLATGKTIPKWDAIGRVGLYMCTSPRHARNVSAVLSLYTGLVSPQFHVQHDEFFETVRPKAGNTAVLSHWQTLSGLRLDGKSVKAKSKEKFRGTTATVDVGVIPAAAEAPGLFVLEEETPPHVPEEDDPPPSEVATDEVSDNSSGPTIWRPARMRRPNEQDMKYLEQRNMAFAVNLLETEETDEAYYDTLCEEYYRIHDEMKYPVAFMYDTDEDTLYYNRSWGSLTGRILWRQ
jgi:hypothetical protein